MSAKDPKLAKYRRKRDPGTTSEPFSPEPTSSTKETRRGRFVVHEHAARRRHWDLRIEMGGVLKSFAVPRGPSLDPTEKRLAVETEDHPITYLDFEAIIPENNYGAGAMIIWDLGIVEYLETSAEGGHASGKIDFQLWGHKLKGRFALVRTSGRGSRAATKQPEWLLFKKTDPYSRAGSEIVEAEPHSVLSSLKVEELANREAVAASIVHTAIDAGAPLGSFEPRRLVPMLCVATETSLEEAGFYYELKLDGVRILANKRPEGVGLYYRTHRPATQLFPEIVRAVESLAPSNVVLDGEIVAFDESGKPNFQRLARRLHASRPTDIIFAKMAVPTTYLVFDILSVEDRDLRSLPLSARKRILGTLVRGRGFVRVLDPIEDNGKGLYEFCKAQGLEGVVKKRADSPYQPGPTRSNDWIKIKCEREDDFVIFGYTTGNGTRRDLGALHLGSYDGDLLRVRGRAGSGLDQETIDDLLKRMKSIQVAECPAIGELETRNNIFVEPVLVASIQYVGFSEEGRVKHPVFRGLRPDFDPRACIVAPHDTEHAASPSETEGIPSVSLRRVKLTNQQKVFWPGSEFTKGDLCNYYEAISETILPHLAERPVVMVRYPDGITGKWFYQWRIPVGAPSWVRAVPHRTEDDDGRDKLTVLIDDVDTLLYVANLGCIPLHVIASRLGSLEECDFLTIDFDVAASDLRTATTLAHELRSILDEIGMKGYPKTSGQTGLHVLIPLGPGISFETAKILNELLGRIVVSRHPKVATMERRKEKRGPRVYIDTGQTGRSRTIVAPYSVRAYPGATVSTPLSWDEVGMALDPSRFTMFTVPERVATLGDPMQELLLDRPDIPAAVAILAREGSPAT